MHVEDHPIEYARFEGTIPKGQYGGGTVMVWDIGTYTVKDENPVRAFYSGKLHLFLKGKKLSGEWALVKTKSKPTNGQRDNIWFLIKVGDSAKTLSPRRDDQSVLTRRSMAAIAKHNDAQWQSNR
jgi:bifunctional non-homologous end joining protein LigD